MHWHLPANSNTRVQSFATAVRSNSIPFPFSFPVSQVRESPCNCYFSKAVCSVIGIVWWWTSVFNSSVLKILYLQKYYTSCDSLHTTPLVGCWLDARMYGYIHSDTVPINILLMCINDNWLLKSTPQTILILQNIQYIKRDITAKSQYSVNHW